MSASRVTASSIAQGLPKSRSLLAGNYAYGGGATWLIERINVGSAGAASVTFSSIPQTFKHLQIRCIAQQASTGGYVSMTLGSSTFTYRHYLYGSGASASAGADTTNAPGIFTSAYSTNANIFAASIIDILDYRNVNKNITTRSLGGADSNGSGSMYSMSSLFTSSAAISSIALTAVTQNFTQYSTFALYGVVG